MSKNIDFNSTGATFSMNLDSDNQAFADDPKGEVTRLLKSVIEKIENGDEFSDLYDINGNLVGDWCLDVSGEEWPTEKEAVEQFKAYLEELGRDFDNEYLCDEDALAQEWANWVDQRLTDGVFPTDCTGWDYE